jgi:hypothetical protein
MRETTQTELWLRDCRLELNLEYEPSRERALVMTKIDEALLWLSQAPRKADERPQAQASVE